MRLRNEIRCHVLTIAALACCWSSTAAQETRTEIPIATQMGA